MLCRTVVWVLYAALNPYCNLIRYFNKLYFQSYTIKLLKISSSRINLSEISSLPLSGKRIYDTSNYTKLQKAKCWSVVYGHI